MMLQQLLKQQAAAARRLQGQRQAQQMSLAHQQQLDSQGWGQQQLSDGSQQASGSASGKFLSGVSPAAARAASRLRRHHTPSSAAADDALGSGFSAGRTAGAGSIQPHDMCKLKADVNQVQPTEQLAARSRAAVTLDSCKGHLRPVSAASCSSFREQDAVPMPVDCMGALGLIELQQLRSEYGEVLGVFEQLLVTERRGRMQAEPDMAQLLRQLRAEGRQRGQQVRGCGVRS
jgi:hypothetical protein